MSLNKFMHERNPYKKAKPDFKQLALKYDAFRKVASTDLKGDVAIDFKNPECLKALSWCLLKENHALDVDFPPDSGDVTGIDIGTGASCVYPLLGARKNSWNFVATETDDVSYTYAKHNIERNALQDKIKLLRANPRDVLKAPLEALLSVTPSASFDFCMCNPPFFSSNLEAWGLTNSRNDDRAQPKSVSTANASESVFPGGEVEFVRHMIADSLLLRHRIRIYSTMLGKKTSIAILREDLKKSNITNVGTTEFCQGRTMRWGLAWSFDDSVSFPKSHKNALKATKPQIYQVPCKLQNCPEMTYSKEGLTEKLLALFTELQMEISAVTKLSSKWQWRVTAHENTWSHQRRKRRQRLQAARVRTDAVASAAVVSNRVGGETAGIRNGDDVAAATCATNDKAHTLDASACPNVAVTSTESRLNHTAPVVAGEQSRKRAHDDVEGRLVRDDVTAAKRLKVEDHAEAVVRSNRVDMERCDQKSRRNQDNDCDDVIVNVRPSDSARASPEQACNVSVGEKNTDVNTNTPSVCTDSNENETHQSKDDVKSSSKMDANDEECLLCCHVTVRKDVTGLVVQLDWMRGSSKEAMQQVMQYIRNRLK